MFTVNCLGWSAPPGSESQAGHGAISTGATMISMAEGSDWCAKLLKFPLESGTHHLCSYSIS